ncbi:MFS transporter [Limnohabitans sp. 2KL-1]|jgi:MFS family permease|uniref:MFS transporter n=1 Tax=Limnohabitans sp. 2KL-1 TaxID=1100699 RepID=UPI000D3795A5|nr:MFS transporter [Limnohabitans sp. 2KL-1]PUE45640.1 MFS transporter [Limnohabitans sp. 2KL-1]
MTQAQDPHSLQALRSRYGERHRWLLLLSVMLGSMAAVMSSTIMNVAIPDMSQHFTLGQSRVQWVTSGFMVAMTVSMLTTPWLLSRYGYRRVYEVCMWLLLGGGVVGGFANDFPLVMAARVAEGLAAGVVQPIPAIIILRAFAPEEQGRASSLFGMGVVLAPAIGPSIGGVLVDVFGWRSIFFMVVPLAMVGLWLSRRYVPTSAPGGVQADADSPGLDWIGLALASASTLMLLNGLVQLRGDDDTVAVVLLALAGVGMAVFVAWQRYLLQPRRHARRTAAHKASRQGMTAQPVRQVPRGPLMNLQVFGHRNFAMGSLVSFTYGIALFGSTYLLPVYMQMGLGLSPSYIGAALLPAGILLAVTIAVVGRLSNRFPPAHWVSWGLALLALSFALMPLVHPAAGLTLLWFLVILGRIGLGFILPSLNLGALRGLPKDLIPQASSVIGFARMLGGAAGVSICAIVLEWRLAVHAASQQAVGSVAGGAAGLRAFNETFEFLAVITALALLAAWKMGESTVVAAKD